MIVAIHKKDDKVLISVCDKELVGKKFEEGIKQLDLTGRFYRGEEKDAVETGDLIRNADFANFVGKQSIQLGVEEGVIDEDAIRVICDIPFAETTILH